MGGAGLGPQHWGARDLAAKRYGQLSVPRGEARTHLSQRLSLWPCGHCTRGLALCSPTELAPDHPPTQ